MQPDGGVRGWSGSIKTHATLGERHPKFWKVVASGQDFISLQNSITRFEKCGICRCELKAIGDETKHCGVTKTPPHFINQIGTRFP